MSQRVTMTWETESPSDAVAIVTEVFNWVNKGLKTISISPIKEKETKK